MCPGSVALEQTLLNALTALAQGLPPPRRMVVAWSGGRDSSVLLHALAAQRAQLPCELLAVHVNHGLQPAGPAWAEHCMRAAAGMEIPFQTLTLADAPAPGDSLEAWAREARYQALADLLGDDDFLLTAHHQDDQAESFLLGALRGSGPAGLRGIAPRRRLGTGWLLRPMLEIPAAHIEAFARAHDLQWLEDPMNTDHARARSFLRSEILPRLRTHWPAAGAVLARSARWQADSQLALEACAQRYLDACPEWPERLPLTVLEGLPEPLVSTVIRHWIHRLGHPVPDARRLAEILRTVLPAAPDRVPEVSWGGISLRKWQQALYLDQKAHVAPFAATWDPARPLTLPGGVLSAQPAIGRGLRQTLCRDGLVVRSREGGERIRLPGRSHHTTVKHALQALGVPPWRRAALPLVYAGGALAAVGDLMISADALAGPDEAGWQLEWQDAGLMRIVCGPGQESANAGHD